MENIIDDGQAKGTGKQGDSDTTDSPAATRGGIVSETAGIDSSKAARAFGIECNSLSRKIIFLNQGYS